MPNYVKIPREIIYNKELSDKRVIIFAYLCSRRALDDTVAFSISELCHWSYLKPNYHDGKINHKYLEVLELLSHYEYFDCYPNFEKLAKEKKNSTDYYNIKINTEKFDIPDNFGIIYFNELEKILNFKEELRCVRIDKQIRNKCRSIFCNHYTTNYHPIIRKKEHSSEKQNSKQQSNKRKGENHNN